MNLQDLFENTAGSSKIQGVAGGLNEFSFDGNDDGQPKDDPYKYPKPEHYRRSIDFFGKFEANHFDKEDMDDATGVFKGYWYYGNNLKQIAYFKFDNPQRTGSNDPGMGWYYEPQDEDVAEGYSLGKVLSLPELLDQIKHILAAKHPGIGWRMTMPAENTFLFSAKNDYNVWSMLVVEPGGDDWVAVGHGMVDPDGKPIIFDRQQLPMTLASASEIADEAIQTYHDIDLSDYADDEDYNQGVAEGSLNEFAPGGNSSSSYYAVTANFVSEFSQQKEEEIQDLIAAGWTKQDLEQAGTLQGQAADIAHFEQVRDGFLKGLKPGFDAYLQGDTQMKDQLGEYWLDNDLPLNQDWEKIYGEPWGEDMDEGVAEGNAIVESFQRLNSRI